MAKVTIEVGAWGDPIGIRGELFLRDDGRVICAPRDNIHATPNCAPIHIDAEALIAAADEETALRNPVAGQVYDHATCPGVWAYKNKGDTEWEGVNFYGKNSICGYDEYCYIGPLPPKELP